ncbi:hypothetical protein M9H77_23751 [Catharanthus roseus]|uniref:Uncharacterized protein n=1 Tax=Catharanthus roseus TaxID=4058 RepID=A0ACC0AWZ8_CATRO|nr:hypothetical protein M9H77_23751 [Catharanthus roseus]
MKRWHHVLPEDASMPLTSPPEVCIVTKGRKKMNSSKRDKSYWEHVSIAHRKIQKSSGSGSGFSSRSGSGSGSGSGSCEKGRPPRAPRDKGRGRRCSHGRNSLSSVIDPTPCSTFPYTDAFPTFIYPFIENWKNVIGDGNYGYQVVEEFVFGDEHQWPESGLVLNSFQNTEGASIPIACRGVHRVDTATNAWIPTPPLYVQWILHHIDRVSSWANAYYNRIADWNVRVAINSIQEKT